LRAGVKAGTLSVVTERETQEAMALWRPSEALPPGASFVLPTRRGGASVGAYTSLNLGQRVGDDPDRVARNQGLVRGTLGIPADGPRRVRQVHGTRIVSPREVPSDADGFLIEAGDPWVAVSVADCAPVALFARDGSRGALVHSGWRGARDGIAPEAVRRLGTGEIVAFIGPCIHACCYPVGPDVAESFPPEATRPHPEGVALDLPLAIRLSLLEAGVPAESIHAAPECTSCDESSFYSHRRDRGVTGRHWALARLAPLP
jgi:YfiH family protein